ncbi:cellulose synthase operon protein c [Anaeramoeba flamelloides]|uniref:Cellulose synthase operon protein c n=1 Tax=Anaeramoeba flamelloides TaxID=1746091 RepID=A0ABQ8Z9X8_9EUKA|nr:cellulose synthase operon protein c [Anaeramoeba flamelloides]
MLKSIYNWIKSKPYLMEHISIFVDEVNVDASKSLRNTGYVEETLSNIKQLNFFDAANSLGKAVGFNPDRITELINIVREDLVIVDRIVLAILGELSKHINYTFLNTSKVFSLTHEGGTFKALQHLLGSLKLDYSFVMEYFKLLENKKFKQSTQMLMSVFQIPPWLEKLESLKGIKQFFRNKQMQEISKALCKVFPLKEEDFNQLFEDFGRIKKIFEEEQMEQKLEEFLTPLIPKMKQIEDPLEALYHKIKPTVNGKFWLYFAQLRYSSNSYKVSYECLEKAQKISPEDPEIWNLLGMNCIKLQKYDEALTNFDKALELKNDKAEFWNNKASLLSLMGDDEKANTHYVKASSLDSSNPDLLIQRAGILFNMGKFDDSISVIGKALEMDPENGLNWLYKASILLLNDQKEDPIPDLDKAMEFIDLELRDSAPYYFLTNGHVSFAKGKFRNAIWEYDQFINKSLMSINQIYLGIGFLFQGLAYEKLENIEKAKDKFELATNNLINNQFAIECFKRVGGVIKNENEKEKENENEKEKEKQKEKQN